MPPTHCSPCAQGLLHLPQFEVSICKSKQAWLQTFSPAGQLGAQVPLAHTWLELHALPQPPQFFASVSTFTQVLLHAVVPEPQRQVP